jgi:hypothetical protein
VVLQAGLLQDTVQGTWSEVVVARPGNRDQARFRGVLELLMASSRPRQDPAIVSKEAQNVTDFHVWILRQGLPIVQSDG